MKIWIDLTNSPHVNIFDRMIRELRNDHEIVLTCRPLANTIDLLEMAGFSCHVIGSHYGQSKLRKILGFLVRVLQLLWFLKGANIDVAISHSSFYSPVVSRLLGIRCIYLNDNEHAEGNRLSFVFADTIMVPEFLDIEKIKRQWARNEKIIRYPGIKEGIYLWPYESSDSNITGCVEKRVIKTIFVRPEPWAAQYYKGERNFIDDLLLDLKEKFKIVLLPRGAGQEEYYRNNRFDGIIVPEKSISLSEIMDECDLFIGAGGTMTREAAVLGIPTISIYQDELLDVDNYLIDNGNMIHRKVLDAAFVMDISERTDKRSSDTVLLHKGKKAFELIKDALLQS